MGRWAQLTVTQLRKLCGSRALGTRGPKSELVKKLLKADENMEYAWLRAGHRWLGQRLKRNFPDYGALSQTATRGTTLCLLA